MTGTTDNHKSGRLSRDLSRADQEIKRFGVTSEAAAEWMVSISARDLYVLRRATLRVYRHCVGPHQQGDPTIEEIDEMIAAVGPVASENMLRRAVDEKLGEYDRGRFGHSKSDDGDFRRDT
jgi:hypothetical protein